MTGLSQMHRRLAMSGLTLAILLASPVSSLADLGRIESSGLARDRVLAREVDTKNRVKGSRAFGRDLDRGEFSEVRGMLLDARAMGRKIAVDLTVLEEWELGATSGQDQLMARYYYAEEGDIPVAGDFRMGPGPNGLVRLYFVVDRQGSVLGLVDEGGAWVERVRYDVWGTPVFEAADVMAPEVSRVGTDPGTGDVVIVMSEPVVPRAVMPTAPNQNVALEAIDLSSEVYFEDAMGQELPGQIVVDLDAADEPGVPVGSVLRFIPDGAVLPGTQLVLRLNQGALVDDGNLGNADTSLAVTYGAGVSYTGPPAGSTQPVLQAQSRTGNRLLFQSHFWDADVGLYHMRARMFDPRVGMFLSRDPSGFRDSPDLYSGFAWNAVGNRDPSGERIDVTELSRPQRALLLQQLTVLTGRRVVARRVGGRLIVDFGERSTREGGSAHAEKILGSAIRDESVVVVRDEDGPSLARALVPPHSKKDPTFTKMVGSPSEAREIALEFDAIARIQGEQRARLSYGVGIIFFHELIHQYGLRDPKGFAERLTKAGETVDEVNKIRRQLRLPIRRTYSGRTPAGFVFSPEGSSMECYVQLYETRDGKEIRHDLVVPCDEDVE